MALVPLWLLWGSYFTKSEPPFFWCISLWDQLPGSEAWLSTYWLYVFE